MSKTGAKGTTKLGKDSRSKRLGVKIFAGQKVKPGMIIVRQRGSKFIPGENVKKGRDDSLYATEPGVVEFKTTGKICYDGKRKKVKKVAVVNSS